MGNSYKAISVAKVPKTGIGKSYFKRLVHTRNRMLERAGIYLTGKMYKLVVDPWDICDYRCVLKPGHTGYEKYKRK
jgi:hypothetical protein